MDVDGGSGGGSDKSAAALLATTRLRGAKSALEPLRPEVDCYLHLLILLYLLDHDGSGTIECAEDLMKKIVVQNRRSLDHALFDQAYKSVNKTTFPETASNNEWARFLYYLGRIK